MLHKWEYMIMEIPPHRKVRILVTAVLHSDTFSRRQHPLYIQNDSPLNINYVDMACT